MAKTPKIPHKNVGMRNNKLIFAGIGLFTLLVFFGALTILQNIYQTETYWVLKEDVATRTKVTPEMLAPVTTSQGTAPKAAMTIKDVQNGYLYTKYPLIKGDILTESNVGGFEDISTGVPDTWVITSFAVSADDAVGGRIRRGTYFDMMLIDQEGVSYPFVNMLALDTTVSLSGASSNQAADTEEAHAGQTSQYVVGLSPEDAARLQYFVSTNANIKLLLSPRQNEYNPPQLSAYAAAEKGKFTFVAGDQVKDAGKGTDYNFTPLKRDTFGRPIEIVQNCSKGNAKLTEEECKKAVKEANPITPDNTTPSPSAAPSAKASTATPFNTTQPSNEDEENPTPSATPRR